MNTDKEAVIRDYIKKNNLIFYFVFDRDGVISECSQFAADFIKNGAPLVNLKDIFVDFNSKMNPEMLAENPGIEHLMSVNGGRGLPHSFYFTFYKAGEQFIGLARLDTAELETFHMKLIELNTELGTMSRELYKSNAELKKLDEMKNNFLGMAVHDLRKPLTVIKGFTRLLLSPDAKYGGDKCREFLTAIDKAGDSMESIINAFLDLSVLESGKLNLNYSVFDITEAVSDALVLAGIKAEERNINIVKEWGGERLSVTADRLKIQQVIENMAGNAVDYTPSGGKVTLSITCTGDEMKFTAEDEGPGIPDNQKDKLFKPFGRTGAIKASGEKSTGLGLFICKKIIEMHGGSVGVENKEGRGARFYFTLPLRKREAKNG